MLTEEAIIVLRRAIERERVIPAPVNAFIICQDLREEGFLARYHELTEQGFRIVFRLTEAGKMCGAMLFPTVSA